MTWNAGRHLGALPLLAGGWLVALASCSLLTPLDGLSTGATDDAEAGTSGTSGTSGSAGSSGSPDGSPQGDAGPLPAALYANAVLADGPIAYFHLDETAGPTARSAVGTTMGTFEGMFAFGAESAVGPGGTSVTLDGTSARLDFGDVFAFAGTVSYSLECWFKPSITGDTRFLFERRTTASPAEGYTVYFGTSYFLFARQTGTVEFGYASTDATTTIGAWRHVVTTFNGTVTELYIDGVSVGKNVGATGAIGGGAGKFVLGDNTGGQFNKLGGQVDEFAVYDKGLTAAQVALHFQAAKR